MRRSGLVRAQNSEHWDGLGVLVSKMRCPHGPCEGEQPPAERGPGLWFQFCHWLLCDLG